MAKNAILIIGPTGVGKTPLGQALESHGLQKKTFAHFDFGNCLRAVTAGEAQYGMEERDVAFLVDILKSGALLENENFHLAEKIINFFLINEAGSVDYVVLNGLPRHVGQARDIAPFFNVVAVIHLLCTPEVVFRRIQNDSGGDRAFRADDAFSLVKQKIETFNERTAPLLQHYKKSVRSIVELEIAEESQPGQLTAKLEKSDLAL